jgi:hypothetical protein
LPRGALQRSGFGGPDGGLQPAALGLQLGSNAYAPFNPDCLFSAHEYTRCAPLSGTKRPGPGVIDLFHTRRRAQREQH